MRTALLRSRIAPTPSGLLHLGNVANFLLTERLVTEAGGTLLLRIDDCDGTRARIGFVESIFSTLRWLGIEWQEGPRDAAEFTRSFSQNARKQAYFGRLGALGDLVYACACSRKEGGGGCAGDCRERREVFVPGRHALRLRFPDPDPAARFGDVVLWRKDDGPAYHWASVLDDLDARITLIVRGEDLREASELQRHLARLVEPGGLDGARFVHHPLLSGEDGRKLSKSQGASPVEELIRAGTPASELRARLAPVIGEWASRI